MGSLKRVRLRVVCFRYGKSSRENYDLYPLFDQNIRGTVILVQVRVHSICYGEISRKHIDGILIEPFCTTCV